MTLPISNDLRARIVETYERGFGSYEEVADLLGLGRATVSRVLSRYRRKGDLSPDPHGGGNPARIKPEDGNALADLVARNPDATVAELAAAWRRQTRREISRSSMLRALGRFGITLKKSPSKHSRLSGPTSKKNAARSKR